jgi:hypothetical protein
MKGKLRRSLSPEDLESLMMQLQPNGQEIPFVNDVTNLGVTFDIERLVVKALST